MRRNLIIIIFLYVKVRVEALSVTTKNGKITGYYKQSFDQKEYIAFEGIPYAKPPIGEKRFQEPEPIQNWNSTLEAKHLYTCPQCSPELDPCTYSGNEDCLYINVYVGNNHINLTEKLEVIVDIHGGGFMYGSNHDYNMPGYLMDHKIIFITFNYRLGVLGFLSTEDDILPGNLGMKDQVLALTWIKNNVEYFGGNSNSITLTGLSAGSASVHLHYLSPLSKNLFHRGYSLSGVALNPWVMQRDALVKTRVLAKSLNCTQNSTLNLVACLKTKTPEEIIAQYSQFYVLREVPINLFGLVVENGSNAFLPDEPFNLLIQKKVQDLPWIASFVPHETKSILEFNDNLNKLNQIWKKSRQTILHYTNEIQNLKSVLEKIETHYLRKHSNFTKENYANFTKMTIDRIMLYGIFKSVELQANANKSPVYFYEFSYTGSSSNCVEHGDDVQYLFYDSKETAPTTEELKMKDIMIQLLLHFSKTNKPKLEGVDWRPIKHNDFSFVNISSYNSFQIISNNQNYAHQSFWDSLGYLAF